MRTIKDYYDIVILPPSSIKEYCVGLSEKINKHFDSTLVLGKELNLPHITLLHIAVTPKNLEVLEKRLFFVAKKAKPFQVTLKNLLTYPKFGALALDALPKENFVRLHKDTISATKDVIDKSFDYHAAWDSETLPNKMRKYIDEQGTPFIEEYFIPHITLSLLTDKRETLKAARTVMIKHQQFLAEKIAVCKLAEQHTCQQAIFSIPIK